MKLNCRIHAHGPELVLSDPDGFGRTMTFIVGHGASEYHEARSDAEAIIHAVTCHDQLVEALRMAKEVLDRKGWSMPKVDAALEAVDGA